MFSLALCWALFCFPLLVFFLSVGDAIGALTMSVIVFSQAVSLLVFFSLVQFVFVFFFVQGPLGFFFLRPLGCTKPLVEAAAHVLCFVGGLSAPVLELAVILCLPLRVFPLRLTHQYRGSAVKKRCLTVEVSSELAYRKCVRVGTSSGQKLVLALGQH